MTSIENYAFNEYTSLNNVTIPSSVTSIGKAACGKCCLLKELVILSKKISIENQVFLGEKNIKRKIMFSSKGIKEKFFFMKIFNKK